jgi:hypothetical protein
MGYLPAWQHQYQLPGQEYSFHVSSHNRIQTSAQSDVEMSNRFKANNWNNIF